ncbi:TIGR00153 family protein [Thalassotalea aquiviva]|uniref:TIGR00153 family protein n=1 Tax=Thalassotalea aquiviva TaxID=3242415 RepID=UPI00352BB441
MSGNTILGVFAKSPLKPIERHIRKVHECAALLPSFFDAANSGNWEKANEIRTQISSLEKEADKMKREIRMELPGGIFMPVQRTDLLDMLRQQDQIANKAKDIAGRMIGRQIGIPEELLTKFDAYLSRCIDATKQAAKAINELDDLLETGFGNREVAHVDKMIVKLASIEDDTDNMQIELRQALMAIEDKLSPIDAIFLYQIIEWVGDLADTAERVGARLEMMLT